MTDRPAAVFSLVLVLTALACLASTVALSPVARLIPVIVLLPTCVLLLVQVRADLATTSASPSKADAGNDGRTAFASLWSLVPALSILAFGFIPGMIVFLVLFLSIHARERWSSVLAATMIAWLAFEGLARMAPALDAGQGLLWPL